MREALQAEILFVHLAWVRELGTLCWNMSYLSYGSSEQGMASSPGGRRDGQSVGEADSSVPKLDIILAHFEGQHRRRAFLPSWRDARKRTEKQKEQTSLPGPVGMHQSHRRIHAIKRKAPSIRSTHLPCCSPNHRRLPTLRSPEFRSFSPFPCPHVFFCSILKRCF